MFFQNVACWKEQKADVTYKKTQRIIQLITLVSKKNNVICDVGIYIK